MLVEEFLLETENIILFDAWCTNFYDDTELLQLQT